MIMTGIHIDKEKKKWMFLFAYGIYLVSVILFASKYGEMDSMKIFFPVVRFIAYGLICAKIILDFLEKGYSKKELALIVIVGTLFLISAYVTKDKNLLIYWVFIVAAHDVDFQNIIKWSLWVHVGAVLFVIGSCYGGILENRIYGLNYGIRIRDSLGFQYTTTGSNFFFYMILMWVYWRKNKITWIELAVLIAGNIYLFSKTDTKNAFALGMLAIIGTIILKYIPCLRAYKKIYSVLAVGIVPALSVGIIRISIKYDQAIQWMYKFNELISGRLNLGKSGYLNYGIRLLGQKIQWVGGEPADAAMYNYVDSSYMQSLLNFGPIILALILAGLILMGIFIAIRKDTYFLLVFVLVAVHSTFDPQLTWIGYNCFLMAYSYIHDGQAGEKSSGISVI